jgi:hypothetical protein
MATTTDGAAVNDGASTTDGGAVEDVAPGTTGDGEHLAFIVAGAVAVLSALCLGIIALLARGGGARELAPREPDSAPEEDIIN